MNTEQDFSYNKFPIFCKVTMDHIISVFLSLEPAIPVGVGGSLQAFLGERVKR